MNLMYTSAEAAFSRHLLDWETSDIHLAFIGDGYDPDPSHTSLDQIPSVLGTVPVEGRTATYYGDGRADMFATGAHWITPPSGLRAVALVMYAVADGAWLIVYADQSNWIPFPLITTGFTDFHILWQDEDGQCYPCLRFGVEEQSK